MAHAGGKSQGFRKLRRGVRTLRMRLTNWLDVQLGLIEKRTPRLSLAELDAIPYITEKGKTLNSTKLERTEQLDAFRYVRPYHRVLELGGCYGLVSCVINHNLSDPSKHVVVEPASEVIPALTQNRDAHQAKFQIYNGVVACQPMKIQGEKMSRWTEPCPNGNVPYLPLDKLEQRFGMTFNCLIADCEGGLEQFVRDFPTLFARLDTVLFERDRERVSSGLQCDYQFIGRFLESQGFERVKSGGHPVWLK